MNVCYCKQQIPDGARQIVASVVVDWGADDLRPVQPAKIAVFHSFECLSLWASDRAAAHDGVVVKEGEPVDVA